MKAVRIRMKKGMTFAIVCVSIILSTALIASRMENSIGASPKGFIILSFDDAFLVDKSTAIPIMNEYGYKGVTFFAAKWGIDKWGDYVAAGWEIGCHSYSHESLDRCSMEQLQYEIVYAKQYILANCPGVSEVISYAFPNGDGWGNETVLSLIRTNYKYLRPPSNGNSEGRAFSTDLEALWLSEAQKGVNYALNGGTAWFIFHAVSDQPTEYRTITTATFREILDRVNKSGIVPVTPKQLNLSDPPQLSVTITVKPFDMNLQYAVAESSFTWTAPPTITMWGREWTFQAWMDGYSGQKRSFDGNGTWIVSYR